MNDQLLHQPGGKVNDVHAHTKNVSSSSSTTSSVPAVFSSALHSSYNDDENEALNKPEGSISKPTSLIDESLDSEDLESTMSVSYTHLTLPTILLV